MRYHDKIALIARRQAEHEEGVRDLAMQRRRQRRVELQPEYEAVSRWQDQQIKLRGLCPAVLEETQAKLDVLDAIVAAA